MNVENAPSLRSSARQFRRLLLLVRPYWLRIAQGAAIGVFIGLLALVPPLFTKRLVDSMYPHRDADMLTLLVAGVCGVLIASGIVGTIRSFYSQMVSAQLGYATSLLFFNHVQHLPVSFFDARRVGEITNRFGDVRIALATLSRLTEIVIVRGAFLLFIPPILFAVNWRLAVLSLLSSPLNALITVLANRTLRRYWQRSAEAGAELSAIQIDALSHVRTIKLIGAERETYRMMHAASERAFVLQTRAAEIGGAVSAINVAVKAVTTALCTWYGWTLILRNEISLGDFLAFSVYLGYLTGPVAEFATAFAEFQKSSISLNRMFEYLDCVPEIDPTIATRATPKSPREQRGELSVEKVSFSFHDGPPILRDISIRFSHGSHTAIVGANGTGKSTLVRLLCGIDRPRSGHVFFNGRDLNEECLHDARQQMTVIWQEPGILRGSIRDNLLLGSEYASARELDRALGICGLQDFVAGLPRGLDTIVAEWGATLSGGQRQRIALARALVRAAPVLILDEAMSSLDVGSEAAIVNELKSSCRIGTIIYVTHRLQNAVIADQICAFDAGGAYAIGHPANLMESSEVYRRLWASGNQTGQTAIVQ